MLAPLRTGKRVHHDGNGDARRVVAVLRVSRGAPIVISSRRAAPVDGGARSMALKMGIFETRSDHRTVQRPCN